MQAAALCQYQRPVDYTAAFHAVNTACGGDMITSPASEVYFEFIWDTSMLELLIHVHKSLGSTRKLGILRALLGRQHFNEATDTRTRSRAIEASRHELLHALAREFCP